jgi:hypothetical protein
MLTSLINISSTKAYHIFDHSIDTTQYHRKNITPKSKTMSLQQEVVNLFSSSRTIVIYLPASEHRTFTVNKYVNEHYAISKEHNGVREHQVKNPCFTVSFTEITFKDIRQNFTHPFSTNIHIAAGPILAPQVICTINVSILKVLSPQVICTINLVGYESSPSSGDLNHKFVGL